MATSTFSQGLASLNRKLSRSIPEKAYNAVRAALAQSADEIVSDMKRHAPVDTGDLQMSISWCWGNAPAGTMTLAGGGTGKGGRSFKQGADTTGLRISIYAGGSNEFYAWFVEFGTQFVAAHPFFYPIYRARKRTAKARITRAISKGVRDGAK